MNDKVLLPLLGSCFFCLLGCFSDDFAKGKRTEIVTDTLLITNLKELDLPEQTQSLNLKVSTSPSDYAANLQLSEKLDKSWSIRKKDDQIIATPIIFDNKMFLLTHNGELRCLNLETKVEKFSISLLPPNESGSKMIGGGIALDDSGNLYVTTSFGEVVSLSSESGEIFWRYKFNSPYLSAPTVINSQLFVIDASGISRSFSLEGEQNWIQEGLGSENIRYGSAQAKIADNILLLPTSAGTLNAVDPKTGIKLWDFHFNSQRKGYADSALGDFGGNPVFSGSHIFYGSSNGQFVSLNLAGSKKWQVPVGVKGSPVAIGNSLFFISDLNELTRITKADGSLVWTNPISKLTEKNHYFEPLLAGSRLWITGSHKSLISFDPETGDQKNSFSLGAEALGPPIYYSESIIVYTKSGEILAFK